MDLYPLLRPWLFRLDAETAHGLALGALRRGLAPRMRSDVEPLLACRVFGLDFPNPIGLAAGFDKNAEAFDAGLGLGFGFVEVGTLTPAPQAGNPRPRLFRLVEDRAVINRLGFNNQGLAAAKARLTPRNRARGVVGVNIGRNRESRDEVADFLAGLRALGGLADYLVVNVSSPNTPGLRALQERARLDRLVAELQAARAEVTAHGAPPVPLLVKIAPDLDAAGLAAVADVALERRLDGLIVGNTTTGHRERLRSPDRHQAGGLSGAPLFQPSTECLRAVYRLTSGAVPLIGTGGVASGADAYAKIRAGASLVQLYTALVFEGPSLVGRILGELAALVRGDGFASLAEAVGCEAAEARPATAR